MIVVADSSPLHYLILLEQTELLHRLYERVLIPEAVAAELRAEASPRKVSQWVSDHPSWLSVVEVLRRHRSSRRFDLGTAALLAERPVPIPSSTRGSRAKQKPTLRVTEHWAFSAPVPMLGLKRKGVVSLWRSESMLPVPLESDFAKWLTD